MAAFTVIFYDNDSAAKVDLSKWGTVSRPRVPTSAAYGVSHPSTAGGAVAGDARQYAYTVDTATGAASGFTLSNLAAALAAMRHVRASVVSGDTA